VRSPAPAAGDARRVESAGGAADQAVVIRRMKDHVGAEVPVSLVMFSAVYLGLGVALVALLLRLAGQGPPAAGATAVPETEVAHAP
jgi:cytochrome bd-type quinol oxidase subunit 1